MSSTKLLRATLQNSRGTASSASLHAGVKAHYRHALVGSSGGAPDLSLKRERRLQPALDAVEYPAGRGRGKAPLGNTL